MPKTLLLKTVEVPLRTAMQAMVTAKKLWVQEEVSTFTSTVITTKMASMTASEASTRTRIGTLGRGCQKWLETPSGLQARRGSASILKGSSELSDWGCPSAAHSPCGPG